MSSLRVVEHLDVVEDVRTCFVVVDVDAPLDAFAFEQLEEALGNGVVVTVTATTHAADDLVCLQEGLPVFAGELAALIRVQQQTGLRLAPPHRSEQRLKHDVGVLC